MRRPTQGYAQPAASSGSLTAYPRGAVIAAEAVLTAGQDLSRLHLRMLDFLPS
ncbi:MULTISPECIES: hypothetical protein [Streptomyces]|uniref:Uncharacterized protein n=1 Tax=Streptomyces bobili TaxID=67280 RepID=A0ABZ1QQB3_9ACTN|nr:hypothetical protein [Streptomyces bobili]